MASPAQIAANRSNALKSTGPRTADGKAVAGLMFAQPPGLRALERANRQLQQSWNLWFRAHDGLLRLRRQEAQDAETARDAAARTENWLRSYQPPAPPRPLGASLYAGLPP